MRLSTLLLLVLFCSTAFGQADRVFINAKVYTANDAQPFAEAVAITADTLSFVGSNADAQNYIGAGTEVVDVGGKLILPGLHDVHIHTLEASSPKSASCVLDPWETDPENYGDAIWDCNPAPNSNGWITGWGASIFALLDATRPPKEILDDIYPNTPVAIMEETSHSIWVNSAALSLAGITASTPDPVGGHIVKWGGQPSGLLLDNAGDFVWELVNEANSTNTQANYNGLVNYGLPMLARNGITSMVEGRTYWKRDYVETWQEVKDNGELTARVVLGLWAYPNDPDSTLLPEIISRLDAGDDLLRVNEVKMYSDGITINATAALHEPYINNLGWPFDTGLSYFNPARMELLITQLELQGFDFHIHAIGDRGVTEALDAIEAARNTNGDIGARHRITHCEIVDTADYGRFAQLNVAADMQVGAEWTNPNEWQENAFLIGPQRADNMIPLRSLSEAGAHVTLSSDWDVHPVNPFQGIEHAVTRAPQELPSVEAAVKAYTINGAYTMRQEETTGSLEAGKYADLICVDRDIFTIPPTEIGDAEVTLTVLGGQDVYVGPDFPSATTEQQQRTIKTKLVPTVSEQWFELRFNHPAPTEIYLTVFNANGKLVDWGMHIHAGGQSVVSLDGGRWSEGMYLVEVRPANGLPGKTHKLVVSR